MRVYLVDAVAGRTVYFGAHRQSTSWIAAIRTLATGAGTGATLDEKETATQQNDTYDRTGDRSHVLPFQQETASCISNQSRIGKRCGTSRHRSGVIAGGVAGSFSGIQLGQFGSSSILLRNNRVH